MGVSRALSADRDEWLAIGGYHVAVRVPTSNTGGAYAVAEYQLEPGRLVPPHTHAREQEVSYILEGEIGVRVGGDELSATPGCFVRKPPGVPHTFWNAARRAARVLEIISPGGFETYFVELAALYSSARPPEPHLVADLRERYGITANPEWISELKTRHGLKLLGE